MLFVRPRNCCYCGNGYYALQHVVNYAQSKGLWNITDLEGDHSFKTFVDEALDIDDPFGFYGFGHGNTTRYTSELLPGEPCACPSCSYDTVFSTEDSNNLRWRIVYLLSCLTGQHLGPKIIEEGAVAYAGFVQEWWWMAYNGPDGDPYNDPWARGYFESANELWMALLDGYTFEEAIQASVDKYDYWIEYWMDSQDPYASTLIGYLAWDRDILIGIGDMYATLDMEDPYWEIDNEIECLREGGIWWPNQTCHQHPYQGPTGGQYPELPTPVFLQYLPYVVAIGVIAVLACFLFKKDKKNE